ncbi:MAG: L,D-transpeptidase family protein [Sulfuricurvum sp.]|nr:L,D-transpeptidase family protein [Sulfuricurvum sp.]
MVKKVVISALSAITLYSADIITLYKSGGIKLMDQQALNPSYWSGSLINRDLRFGYFEHPFSLLACSKEKGSLELYTPNGEKKFLLKKRYSAFTGKMAGDKLNEGDLKTPIGIYTLTERKKNVDPFYGPMAFVTSYPNLYDRIRGKKGDGIWIHGVPMNNVSRDPFTRGCIAINNENLVQLDKTINPNDTLLIIDSSLKQWVNPSKYSIILASLYQWKYAWVYNDLDTYLSFYDPSFKRYDGMNFTQFKAYKERIFSKDEAKNIIFKDINIIPYPGEQKNLFWIRFNQTYVSDSHRFEGDKSLLVRLNNDQSLSILTEE